MKRVRVQYFALLREQAKQAEETVETAAGTPAALYVELARRHGFTLPADHNVALDSKAPHVNAGKAFIDYFLGDESMKMMAQLGEFVNLKGVYPPLPGADKIQFVQMVNFDSKQFAEKKKEYKQIFLK